MKKRKNIRMIREDIFSSYKGNGETAPYKVLEIEDSLGVYTTIYVNENTIDSVIDSIIELKLKYYT